MSQDIKNKLYLRCSHTDILHQFPLTKERYITIYTSSIAIQTFLNINSFTNSVAFFNYIFNYVLESFHVHVAEHRVYEGFTQRQVRVVYFLVISTTIMHCS